MKKTITLIVALCAISLTAGAQSMYDALTFGQNNYYGSARSISLGNAVTALGGDTGMIGINPAGSAISNYSVVTFSAGIVNSNASTAYSEANGTSSVSNTDKTSGTRFIVPNFGAIFRFKTYGEVKAVTFSVTGNMTNQHFCNTSISGVNNYTTMSGAFASEATLAQMDPDVFTKYSNPWNDSPYSWNVLSAYNSNAISYSKSKEYYLGLYEVGDGVLGGPLYQTSVINRSGGTTDLTFNLAMNLSDKFFAGINVGIPSQRYQYEENFTEIPVDKEQFPITFVETEGGKEKEYTTYPESSVYRYTQYEAMTGVYAKLGFIWLPVQGLRVGGAIQSPTGYSVSESWQVSQSTSFTDSYYSMSSTSPQGSNRYYYRSPWEFNLGVAYTFGTRGLLSVDYEFTDYSAMKFSYASNFATDGDFSVANKVTNLFSGLSHQLRVGGEFIIAPHFSARAGFGLRTNPIRYYQDYAGETVDATEYANCYQEFLTGQRVINKNTVRYQDGLRTSYSLGFGYSSRGSFFADLAARYSVYPTQNYAPYGQYYLDVDAPNIAINKGLLDVVLTLGMRF